jgi:GT2 family glycosyltransferase
MNQVAIVILNYNGKAHLECYLPSVIKYKQEQTVIIADNASTDDSIEFLKAKYPTIRIIENKENYGFAKGYNESLQIIKDEFDYFLMLNNDVEVTKDWIAPLLSSVQKENIVACQPKILSYNSKNCFEHAGAVGGFIDEHYFPFCRGRIFDSIEKDDLQYETEQKVSWTSGAAMLISTKVFFEVGGFDDDFFAHMEEIDLCLRIQKKGYELRCNPKSVVYHLGGGTMPYNSEKKVYLNFRNNLFLIVKNHPGFLFPKLVVRMTIDFTAALKFLFEGKIKHSWSVLKAHISFYLNILTLLKKRSLLKTDSHNFIKYNGSILWAYFIQKNNKYSKLNKRKF